MNENKNLDPKLEEALKGIWESLTGEQREKAKACKTLDELIALAGKECIELPDELLDAVAGGYLHHLDWDREKRNSFWEVIDDKTGEVKGRDHAYQAAAEMAEQMGQSTNIVGDWQLEQIRKKAKGC